MLWIKDSREKVLATKTAFWNLRAPVKVWSHGISVLIIPGAGTVILLVCSVITSLNFGQHSL